MHTRYQPFKCHCGKAFTRLDNLGQHMDTVHGGLDSSEENRKSRNAARLKHQELKAKMDLELKPKEKKDLELKLKARMDLERQGGASASASFEPKGPMTLGGVGPARFGTSPGGALLLSGHVGGRSFLQSANSSRKSQVEPPPSIAIPRYGQEDFLQPKHGVDQRTAGQQGSPSRPRTIPNPRAVWHSPQYSPTATSPLYYPHSNGLHGYPGPIRGTYGDCTELDLPAVPRQRRSSYDFGSQYSVATRHPLATNGIPSSTNPSPLSSPYPHFNHHPGGPATGEGRMYESFSWVFSGARVQHRGSHGSHHSSFAEAYGSPPERAFFCEGTRTTLPPASALIAECDRRSQEFRRPSENGPLHPLSHLSTSKGRPRSMSLPTIPAQVPTITSPPASAVTTSSASSGPTHHVPSRKMSIDDLCRAAEAEEARVDGESSAHRLPCLSEEDERDMELPKRTANAEAV